MNEHQHGIRLERAAAMLRIGMGLVFVIGGLSKLSQLLGPAQAHDAMVAQYLGGLGYINAPFQQYLFFEGSPLSPSVFLTLLSSFELVSGIALLVGLFVRPLALFYGLLLWTFVVSLPTHTVPGGAQGIATYTSPAIFVQIRDIALSGMMFVLFNLGAGARSLDQRLFPHVVAVRWEPLGVLLRVSLGIVFIVAGFFGGFAHIATFGATPWLLAPIGLALIFGGPKVVRAGGVAAIAVFVWFVAHKLNLSMSVIANLNGFKREFALAAAAAVLVLYGGGESFTLRDLLRRAGSYRGRRIDRSLILSRHHSHREGNTAHRSRNRGIRAS